MADYSALKATIDASINTNGQQAITGAILNDVLNEMVDVLGEGYTFLGVATPTTNPTTPEGKAYYLAGAAGTYSNFGNIVVNDDEVALLVWGGTAWSKVVSPAASKEEVGQLGQKVDELEDYLLAKEDTINVTWTDGMIYNGSSVSTNAAYKRSNPIKMYVGDILSFTGGASATGINVAAIAKYDNGSYSRILFYSTHSQEDVEWTATEECYVVISTEKSLYSGDVVVSRKGEITKIKETDDKQNADLIQLQNIVNGVNAGQNNIIGILNSSGILTDSNAFSACIDVTPNIPYKIVGNSAQYGNTIYAFLKSKPTFGAAVEYATNSQRSVITGPRIVSGTIPSDAKYLLVSVSSSGTDFSPSAVYLDGSNYYETIPEKFKTIDDAILDIAEWQRKNKNLGYIPITPTEQAGYFLLSGLGDYPVKTATSNTNFVVTTPVSLKAGETLFISCTPVPNRPVSAFCTEGGVLGEVAINPDGSEEKTYHLYAQKDCYLMLSFDASKEHTIWKVANLPEHLTCTDEYMRFGINTDNTYYDYDSQTFLPGNNIWCSRTLDVAGKLFIDFSTYLPSGTTSSVALITYLTASDEYIIRHVAFPEVQGGQTYANRSYIPIGAAKAVVCQRTGYAKNTIFHIYGQENNPFAEKLEFSTMREMVSSRAKGIVSVGTMRFKNIVSSPKLLEHTQAGASDAPYFDANNSFAQYQNLEDARFIEDGILDGNIGEEINFVPEAGYLRKIVGKGEDDKFYVCFFPSSYGGSQGNANRVHLESTSDFVTFESIFKGSDNNVDGGITISNISINDICVVKECADGSLIVGCVYTDNSQPSTDSQGHTLFNRYLGAIRISTDRTSAAICTGSDIDGETSRVIGTHQLADGGTAYVSANMYDWSLQVYGKKVLMTEYGSRDNLHDDWGRVWFSDDCGVNWKEVFQTRNHIDEGTDGTSYQSHTHGIMIDPYSDTIWVIVGETNRNLFYTDKGMQAGDADWTCLPIREQLILPQISYMQVVNGYPFKDRIVFGSDNSGVGALYAINRLEDGGFSDIEVAHEVLPFNFAGTTYCAAAQSRRDANSPALLCVTRENQASTEAQNELLMQQHLGRVIATWDGINFFEIWHDNSFGTHPAKVGSTITTKNYAYCTRDMQAWLTKGGDLVVKYAGRNYFYYGGADYSSVAYGDFCSRCYVIRNAERYFVVK